MKKIAKTADQLSKQSEEISLNILTHNPDIRSLRNVKSLKKIQHDIMVLVQRYTRLWTDIGEKIKE